MKWGVVKEYLVKVCVNHKWIGIHHKIDFDPNGTTFRFGGSVEGDEVFIDIAHLKTMMSWLADSFQKISREHGLGRVDFLSPDH